MLMQLKNASGARGSESPDGWKPYGGRRVRYVFNRSAHTHVRTYGGRRVYEARRRRAGLT